MDLNEKHQQNQQNDEFQETFSQIISISWKIILGATILSLIIGLIFSYTQWFEDVPSTWYAWPLSYLLGAMVNLFAFNLLKNNIATLSSNSNRAGASTNYLIRFAIYGFILYLAYQNTILNVVVVALGFLTVKIAIYIHTFYNNR